MHLRSLNLRVDYEYFPHCIGCSVGAGYRRDFDQSGLKGRRDFLADNSAIFYVSQYKYLCVASIDYSTPLPGDSAFIACNSGNLRPGQLLRQFSRNSFVDNHFFPENVSCRSQMRRSSSYFPSLITFEASAVITVATLIVLADLFLLLLACKQTVQGASFLVSLGII